MKLHPGLVTDAEGIKSICDTLKGEPIVAFDTEFIRETSFFPKLEILQIASKKDSWLIDIQAFTPGAVGRSGEWGAKAKKPEALKPLLDLLTNPDVLKVLHAAQADQECLYTSLGIVAHPTMDTAVAAGLCGYGDGVGLANLLKSVSGVRIKKGHARTNWSARPLPKQLEEYAHADVIHLVETAEKLIEDLDRRDRRKWAIELSAKWEDTSLYEADPDGMAENLARGGRVDEKAYPVLRELMRWREARIRSLNVPRKWLADDSTLMDLSRVRPKDIDHLKSFRGLNKGEVRNGGKYILGAIRKGEEVKDLKLPKRSGKRPPSSDESRAIDLIRCYVGIIAANHDIAARHLVTSAQYVQLLRSKATNAQELADEGILSPGAARLAGDELIALIAGKRALSLKDGGVKVVGVEGEPQ